MKELHNFVDVMVDALPILIYGTKKGDFPPYSEYIYSDGKILKTCNNSIYVEIRKNIGFHGCINLYIININDEISYI